MCLGCHDGVTALDSYGGDAGTVVLAGSAALAPAPDNDLSDDHPIGIDYPDLPAEYQDPLNFADGINDGPGVVLVDGKVECTSCHHVHNNGLGMFLRAPIQQSYLCLQCHIK